MKKRKSIIGALLLSTVLAGNVFAGDFTGVGVLRLFRQHLRCRRFTGERRFALRNAAVSKL